jgi:hypothetical protein
MTASVPDTTEARAFAEALVETEVREFAPISGGGASFVYHSLSFVADGSWSATATVTAGDEGMDCQESGRWTLEQATAAETAILVWTVGKTTCASREVGAAQRVQMTILESGEYKIAFR